MNEWLIAAILLGLAVLPWLIRPVHRAVPTVDVGWVYELLIFGLFFPISNLSDRLNSLERKEKKLKDELKLVTKLREDEVKFLEKKVALLNNEYRNHLHDHGGKRRWWYLFRKAPVPALGFISPVIEERKSKNKFADRTCTYTLEDLPPEFRSQRKKVWTYKDPANQRILDGNNNQKQKNQGGNNQQKNGNNSNNSNNQ